MLIKSARRTVNTNYEAEATLYEKTDYQRQEDNSATPTECNVIALTFSDGRVCYYAPIPNILVREHHYRECYGDPLLFANLLANLFSQ
jgi:hypothetical protein